MARKLYLRALLLSLTLTPEIANDDKVKGKWEKGSHHMMEGIRRTCSQVWVCEAPMPTISAVGGKKEASTVGQCSADGGAIDDCNSCIAGEPKDACEFEDGRANTAPAEQAHLATGTWVGTRITNSRCTMSGETSSSQSQSDIVLV